MSAHTKTRHIRKHSYEIILKIAKKEIHSYLPLSAINEIKSVLKKYSREESVHWTEIAKDDIKNHGQAGMVLRGARFRENMSQKELAKRSGVSQENISRIENGKRQVGEKVAKKLAKPLKIDYLLLIENYATKDSK